MRIKDLKFWSLVSNFDFCVLNFAFKRGLYLLSLLTTAFIISGCGTLARYKAIKPEEVEKVEIKKPIHELRIGEKLTYEVYWMRIPVGIAIAEVKDLVEINGRKVYHLVGSARSNKWLSMIFKVDDYVESLLDKEKLVSVKYTAIRNEGKHRVRTISEYDWQNKILRFKNLVDGTDKNFPLSTEAVDEFSALYYFRVQNISLNKPLEFFVKQAEKNWLIKIEISTFGKTHIPGVGVFDSFMIEPKLELENKPFEKGRAWIWVSNDERRIPLIIKLQVDIPIVGTVWAILRKIE